MLASFVSDSPDASAEWNLRRQTWNTAVGHIRGIVEPAVIDPGRTLDPAGGLSRSSAYAAAMPRSVDALSVLDRSTDYRSAWRRRQAGFGRGYILRRYGLLHGPTARRTLLTEAVVVLGDLLLSRDLAALRGRLAGWHAAGARVRLPLPPADCLDHSISFRDSLALRRGAHQRHTA
jgi:N-acetylglucosaminyl-diphospho-decaprenol L-rhamnosyltransferase